MLLLCKIFGFISHLCITPYLMTLFRSRIAGGCYTRLLIQISHIFVCQNRVQNMSLHYKVSRLLFFINPLIVLGYLQLNLSLKYDDLKNHQKMQRLRTFPSLRLNIFAYRIDRTSVFVMFQSFLMLNINPSITHPVIHAQFRKSLRS